MCIFWNWDCVVQVKPPQPLTQCNQAVQFSPVLKPAQVNSNSSAAVTLQTAAEAAKYKS